MPADAVTASPQIVILAGPNGAGKSTVQPLVTPPTMAFLNADNIARELRESGRASGAGTDIAAGRLLVERMEALTALRQSFCVETNLASRTLAQRIPIWRSAGYLVYVLYLWLPDPALAVARVALRVRAGGHDIPEGTVRRRYHAGLRNFFQVYTAIVDGWRVYDNSGGYEPRLVACGTCRVKEPDLWHTIRNRSPLVTGEDT